MRPSMIIVKATLLSASLAPLLMAQQKAPAPQASKPVSITKVEFVPEYQILRQATAKPKPGGVIAVVQLNLEGGARDIAIGLDDYLYQFADSASKMNSLPAFAVGEQFESGGVMEQWWHVVNAGLIRGSAGPSERIGGLTILALLPDYATSFTLTIKHLHFVSEPIQRPAKGTPPSKTHGASTK
jgi:hypothetical protein